MLPEVLLTGKGSGGFQNLDKEMPGSLPTRLCPQTPTTVGLALHHQTIQPRHWEELQAAANPQNHRPVSIKPNLYNGDTDFSTLLSAEGLSAKAGLGMEELDWDKGAGLGRRSGTEGGGAGLGWRSWTGMEGLSGMKELD